MRVTGSISVLLAASALLLTAAASAEPMSDELRGTISRIVILPVPGESDENITGTYGEQTDGLAGGMAKGAGMGQVPVEVGHVPVSIPIPFLREIGMLVGGMTGALERRTQDLRDRMSDDLASAVDQPLNNIALATDVYWGLREVPPVDPELFATTTPIPTDTHAILYINIDEVTLNIQKDEAIVTTIATARLQDYKDGKTLYRTQVAYSDRDELKNWAQDNYAYWHEYKEFARHYLGRELVAQMYERVGVEHTLTPVYGRGIKVDKKDPWRAETRSLQPTLAWNFELAGVNAGKEDLVTWDLEIYDSSRPVYRAQRINGTEFALDVPLEACKTYRWSVRPSYEIDGRRKDGIWMRKGAATAKDNGNLGRAVSVAHAYIQDFAVLDVDCKAK